MKFEHSRRRFLYAVGGILTARISSESSVSARLAAQIAATPVTPWTRAQMVEPGVLAKELAATSRPTIFCVGFQPLYLGGHVPGASYHGPASTPEGNDGHRVCLALMTLCSIADVVRLQTARMSRLRLLRYGTWESRTFVSYCCRKAPARIVLAGAFRPHADARN